MLFQELKKVALSSVEDNVYYHGTSKSSADKIKSTGFHPGQGGGMGSESDKIFVYLAKRKSDAARFANQNARIKEPIVVAAIIDGKILQTNAADSWSAIAKAGEILGVPYVDQESLTYDPDLIAKAMRKEGYAGIAFRDSYGWNAASIAALPEKVKYSETMDTKK